MSKASKIVLTLACAFLLASCVIGHLMASGQNVQTARDFSKIDATRLPVTTMSATYVYNVADIRESVGMADYVCIGKVLSNDGTVYEHVVAMEKANGGFEKVGDPYTKYTVQVVENIKGKLQMDQPITLKKDGGIAQDGKSVWLYEDDILPQVGKYYVFLAYAQEDGSLLVSGADSNVLVEEGKTTKDKSAIVNSAESARYEKAVQNEIVPLAGENSTSIYDAYR